MCNFFIHTELPNTNITSGGFSVNNIIMLCVYSIIHYLRNMTPCEMTLFRCLHRKGFDFEARGEIDIRGRGQMMTYFLLRNSRASEDRLLGKKQAQTTNSIEVTFINDGRREHPPGSSGTSGSRSPLISRNKVQPAGMNSLPGQRNIFYP